MTETRVLKDALPSTQSNTPITLWDKDGKEAVFQHAVDAREAIDLGTHTDSPPSGEKSAQAHEVGLRAGGPPSADYPTAPNIEPPAEAVSSPPVASPESGVAKTDASASESLKTPHRKPATEK